jgi:hypothetical protein
MEKSFNVIYEDLEEFNHRFYFQGNKDTLEAKHNRLKYILNNMGVVNIKLASLKDSVATPTENFFYLIHQVQNYYFISEDFSLNQSLIDAISNQDNVFVLFINEREIIEDNCFEAAIEKFKELGVNGVKYYFINNNGLMDRYKEILDFEVGIHSVRYLPLDMSLNLQKYSVKNILDKKFFTMCHNRRMKPHRYGILALLKKYNLIGDCDWSIIEGENYRTYHLHDDIVDIDPRKEIFNDMDHAFIADEIKYFSQFSVKKSFFEDFYKREEIDWVTIFPESYLNSYINIVTESNFETNDIHITEKAFKPFYFFQIPIIIGNYKYLHFFKERYDFDLFEDLIDLSYDNEPDHRKRLFMAFDEINKLYKNKKKIVKFYKENQERFISNHQKTINIVNDKHDYNFFQKLINLKING